MAKRNNSKRDKAESIFISYTDDEVNRLRRQKKNIKTFADYEEETYRKANPTKELPQQRRKSSLIPDSLERRKKEEPKQDDTYSGYAGYIPESDNMDMFLDGLDDVINNKPRQPKPTVEEYDDGDDDYSDDEPASHFNPRGKKGAKQSTPFGFSSEYKEIIVEEEVQDEDGNIKKPRKKRKTTKKRDRDSEDFYEFRFDTSLSLLGDTLDETNEIIYDSKKLLDEFKKYRQKGSFTAITNQTGNIVSLLTAKLNIIKEINAVKKNVSDLEIKKKDKSPDQSTTDNAVVDKVFSKIMGSASKKNKQEDFSAMMHDLDDSEYVDYMSNVDGIIKNRTNRLVATGRMEFNDVERAMRYENEDVKVVVAKKSTSNDWEFVAIDKDSNIIEDYPLPSKDSCGKMKFDSDKNIAKDNLGNIYDLFFV